MSWPTVALGEVADINPRMPKGLADETEVSFLSMAAVSEAGHISSEEHRSAGNVKKGYTYFQRGDVLLAKITPCFENGKAARTDGITTETGFASTEFHVLRPSSKANADYIFHAVWNSRFRAAATRNMTGSAGQKRVPADFLKRYEIPLPPLDEQRRIAAILDKADALRCKRKRALDLLDGLTQSIFLEMFVRNPSLDWPVAAIEEVSTNMRTGPFGSQLLHSEFTETGIPVLGIDNVVSNEFRWAERRYISEEKYQSLRRYTVLPSDLLITIMGTCGRCAVAPQDIPTAINTKHICCITLNNSQCLPEFLHTAFMHHPEIQRQLGVRAKGAVMPGLNMGIIKSLKFPLPPLHLQQKFVERLIKLKENSAATAGSLSRFDALFASLQSRAFAGEL